MKDYPLALSTGWNYRPDNDPGRYLDDVQDIGLRAVELSYRLTRQQVDRFIPLIAKRGMEVVSVHSFCPAPDDETTGRHPSSHYRISSLNEREREKAVFWTAGSVDTAVRSGAGCVVIHAGMVEPVEQEARKLIALYREGRKDSPEFEEHREAFRRSRKKERGPYLQAVERSLSEILDYAQKQEIAVGLETRYYPFEIPDFEEIGELLERFKGKGLYYWHDVGHAEVTGRLGLHPHVDFLESYGERMIGVHLHGVRDLRDHHAPFVGDFDLASLLHYFEKVRFRVIEAHYEADKEQLARAVRKLQGDNGSRNCHV